MFDNFFPTTPLQAAERMASWRRTIGQPERLTETADAYARLLGLDSRTVAMTTSQQAILTRGISEMILLDQEIRRLRPVSLVKPRRVSLRKVYA